MHKVSARLWLSLGLATLLFAMLAWLDTLSTVANWDHLFSRWLQGPDNFWLTVFGVATEWLFSPQISIPVVAIAVVLLWRMGHRRGALSLAMFFAVVAAGIVLKFVLKVPSPGGLLAIRNLLRHTSAPPVLFTQYTFPSGHVARATFLVMWLCLASRPNALRRNVIIGVALSLAIAWSRIYVGDHFFFDALGAFALAAMALLTATTFMNLNGAPVSDRRLNSTLK